MTIKVWAKDDFVRKSIWHPSGVRFTADPSVPAEWPDDSFTYRRIRDGDVLTEPPKAAEQPAVPAKAEKKATEK